MNHSNVADRWERGRKGKGHNMYSDGLAVYSYGSHFPIAVWLNSARTYVAFCDDYFSNSTCKHQSCVRDALRSRYVDMVMVTQEGMQRILSIRKSNPDKDVIVVKDIEFQSNYDPMERQ